MKYIIVVDKQPRTNPSSEKKETTIDIEELRRKGDVHDDFVIDKGIAKVYRRIGLTKTHMTYVLDNQVIEELGELKIKLFQGDNYIYIKDEYNNHLCAEFVIKNDFTDRYVTNLQMESAIEETASNIKLYVSQSLEGYSDTEQIKAMIELKASEIKEEVSRDYATQEALEQEKSERVQTANSITQTVSSVKENVENQLKNTEERITKFEQDLDSIELSVTAVKDNTIENVVNGDFKNDLNNWEVSSSGMMGVETINNKKWLYMGIYSYDVNDYISQKITTLMKDTQYRLSFDAYKQEDSDGSINVSIGFYNSSNTLIDSKVVGFTFSNTAQSYNCEFNSPSNFEYAILKFYNKGNPDKEMFIGNISIIGGALWQRVTQLQLSVDGMQSEVNKKVGNDELSTKIQQDYESIQIAWNKISEFIQFLNAQLQIKDADKKLLMALDKEGQRFYHNGLFTGKIGSTQYKEDKNQKGLAFNLDENGRYMCWGVISPDKSSYYAKLWYNLANSFGREKEGLYIGTDLNLNGYNIVGNVVKMYEGSLQIDNDYYLGIEIIDNISEIALLTRRECYFNGDIYSNGYQVLTNTSDGRLKKDIYASVINALDTINQIQHRQFTWKKDGIHENIGYIAQELEQIDPNYVHKNAQYDEGGNVIDYTYQVNLLPILATATKAIQELSSKVNEQQQTIDKQQQFIELLVNKLDMQDEYNTIFSSATTRKARAKKEKEVIFDGEIQYTKRKKINKKHKVIKQYDDGQVEIIEAEEAK